MSPESSCASSPSTPNHSLLHQTKTQVTQVKLPYALDSLEPNIDAKTMNLHYGTHYKAYVDNLNAATAKAGAAAKGSDLTGEWADWATAERVTDRHAAESARAGQPAALP